MALSNEGTYPSGGVDTVTIKCAVAKPNLPTTDADAIFKWLLRFRIVMRLFDFDHRLNGSLKCGISCIKCKQHAVANLVDNSPTEFIAGLLKQILA